MWQHSTALNCATCLMPDINYSAFTLSQIDHPALVAVYSRYWEGSIAVTLPTFLLTLYTVMTKSTKDMSKFRRYTVHQLLWSFAFELYMSVWQPVPLWPYFMGYSAGVLRNWGGENTNVMLIALIFLSVGMGFSIYLSIMLRYLQISPLSFWVKLANNTFLITLHNGIGFALFAVPLCAQMVIYNPGRSELQRAVLRHSPTLKSLFEREPSLFGFDTAMADHVMKVAVAIDAIFFGLMALIFVLYLNYIRILRRNRQFLSGATYKLQFTLFKAICVQVLVTLLVLLLPIAVSYTLAVYGVPWVSTFSLAVLSLTSLHTVADCITLFYFIKPYRAHLLQQLEAVLKTFRWMDKHDTLMSVVVAPPPTSTDSVFPLDSLRNRR